VISLAKPIILFRNLLTPNAIIFSLSLEINTKEVNMPLAVKISDELAKQAKISSTVFKRSLAGQIEFWSKIGRIAEQNENLPYSFIRDILIGLEQSENDDLIPYEFSK